MYNHAISAIPEIVTLKKMVKRANKHALRSVTRQVSMANKASILDRAGSNAGYAMPGDGLEDELRRKRKSTLIN